MGIGLNDKVGRTFWNKFAIHFGRPIPRFVDDPGHTWPNKHLRGHLRRNLSMSFEKSENTIAALPQTLQWEGGEDFLPFFLKNTGTFDLRKICLIFLFVLLFLAASKLKILIPMWCSFRMCTAGDGISQEVESGPHRPHCFGMPRCTKRFWSDSGDKQQQRIRMVQHQPFDCCICLGMFGVFRDTHVNYRINFDLDFTHT